MSDDPSGVDNDSDIPIELSGYTTAFLKTLQLIPPRKKIDDRSAPITVSQTVSFFAIVYEKVRNAVEFREEHLVRRAAIERILTRRLSLNPQGTGEAENLVRELLWARYISGDSLSAKDIDNIQLIINHFLSLRRSILAGRDGKTREILAEYLISFVTCEIEEGLNPSQTQKKAAYLYFFYQVLKNKVEIKNISKEAADSYFYIASEIAYAKNDKPYIRYHLFQLLRKSLSHMNDAETADLIHNFVDITREIESMMKNPYNDKLVRFAKRQVAPFLILFTVTDRYLSKATDIFTRVAELWQKVDSICRQKYDETGEKLRRAAIRSIIYIFATKAVFALILEYPLSQLVYGEVHMIPILINTIFPPILMGLIVSFVHVPDERNTRKIYDRIVNILNKDPSFEQTPVLIAQKSKVRRPVLLLGFTVFYLLTFGITFLIIFSVLRAIGFNVIGMTVFIFFVSLVAFFGYRIRQSAKEYVLEDTQGVLSPIVDFFFVPMLFVGKFLSQEIAKLNIFILIFDFLIEAPFKLISEIVEEWISFVRARKEEIV